MTSKAKNKGNKKIFLAAFCLVVAVAAIVGFFIVQAKNKNKMATSMHFIMNTFVEQKLYGKNATRSTEQIAEELTAFENVMSSYIAGSEVDEINRQAGIAPVKISPETFRLLEISKQFCADSKGIFDVTVAPLALKWGVTSGEPKVPTPEEVKELLQLVDYNDLILDAKNSTAMLARTGQAIELGAVAKGYSCDIFRKIAKENKVTSGYASIGGNMVVIGTKPDGSDFRFGIRDPRGAASEFIASVSLRDKTMATSGDYERFFEEDGVRYHHILDPRTGYPADGGLISVSVISENGALADFLSTTFFIYGKESALKYMNHPDFSLVLVDDQKNVYVSENLKEDIMIPADKKETYTFHFVGGDLS